MAVVLALLSSVAYGVGDFFGGLAAGRAAASAVLLWSHVVGLTLVLAATPFVAGALTAHDLALGAVGGLAGAVGVGLLYQGLAIGPMSAVAPITGVLAAAVPVAAGLVSGERPGLLDAAGMALGLVAVVLVSAEAGGGGLRPANRRAVVLALGAGLGFGVFYVALAGTHDGAGLWPLVGARGASVAAVGLLALASRRRGAGLRVDGALPGGVVRGHTAAAGTLDVAANLLYLLAVRQGLLSVVSVLASLYPAATVVLARVVLRERFAVWQRVGLALAVPAVVLMAR